MRAARCCLLVSVAVVALLGAGVIRGQQAQIVQSPDIIGKTRQVEDYGYLSDARNRQGFWWEKLKYVPLGNSADAPFVTLGGEVRVRYEWIDHTDFGSGPQDTGGYLLTRAMPYVSLTIPDSSGGWKWLFFGQVERASSDYDARGPGPIDEDDFDLLQTFARVTLPLGAGELTIQAGRQIIAFGTERLLGARYGTNMPLSFDGGLVRWKDERWDVSGFYLWPVQIEQDPLDNQSTDDEQLWGIYATRKLGDFLPSLPRAMADFYYLGYTNAAASFNSGSGREWRHTIGTRFFGNQPVAGGALDWNYEGMLQFGSFDSERGNGDILAWSIGTETGYTLDAFLEPRFCLRANIISGDSNASDADLQTFNPLFPKGKYFGELNPVGPYNLINVLGSVGIRVTDQVTLSVQGGPYWRYSADDAVYGVGGNIVRASTASSDARFIGTQVEVVAEWNPVRELAFLVSYSQFSPGAFIEESGPSETIHFVAVEATVQF
ncbi:MAG TPA: alginate export family protein [Chthoniobacterales bacterium]